MSYVAKDQEGEEWIYQDKPIRKATFWTYAYEPNCIKLPSGSIQKLIRRELDWTDEAVEI